jgi:hypothetical protein
MASIVVSGYMLRSSSVATITNYVQYLVGFALLGHDVLYLEGNGWPHSHLCAPIRSSDRLPHIRLARIRDALRAHRDRVSVVWVDEEAGLVEGMVWPQLRRRLARADLIVDLGSECMLQAHTFTGARALLDIDPQQPRPGWFGDTEYAARFSVLANVAEFDHAGAEWYPTAPPVVPQLWKTAPVSAARATFTAFPEASVLAPASDAGALESLIDLPKHAPFSAFGLVLPPGHIRLRERFAKAGWNVGLAGRIADTPARYQACIDASCAELSLALPRHVYSSSGWLSGQSACFLAAGKPVIAQDTGVGQWLPTGFGVVTFDNDEQAVCAVQQVALEPARHARAARVLAEQVFSYRVVLPRLLTRALPRKLGAVA